MMKRVTWFVGGLAAGAAGTGYAKRKVRQSFKRRTEAIGGFEPSMRVAGQALSGARKGAVRVREAVRDGRAAMRNKEDELRARRDLTAEPIDDRLEPGDQLLIDGEPVDSGRVIVLRPAGAQRSSRRFS